MGRHATQFKQIPGRVKATDEELLDCYKQGMFLHQIQMKYKVGSARLRRITRDYDAGRSA